MTRFHSLFVLTLVSACTSPAIVADSDAGSTDGGPTDGGLPDGGPVCDVEVDPNTTELALVGTGAIDAGVWVYLPDGRDNGDRVVFALPNDWPYRGIVTSRTTLMDGRASFALSGIGGLQEYSISGTFDVRTFSAAVHASRNLASASDDVTDWRGGDLTLCPTTSPLPMPELSWTSPTTLDPLSQIFITPTVPLAEGVDGHVRAGDVEIAATIDVRSFITITPEHALPLGEEITVTLTATDVLGREVTLHDATPEMLATTALLTDLSLDTEPVPGSLVGTNARWSDGAIRIGTEEGLYRLGGTALVAIDPGASSVVHVSVDSSWCPYMRERRIALVAADGTSTEATECAADGVFGLPVPAAGPLALVMVNDQPPPRPQWGLAPPLLPMVVTAIALE